MGTRTLSKKTKQDSGTSFEKEVKTEIAALASLLLFADSYGRAREQTKNGTVRDAAKLLRHETKLLQAAIDLYAAKK